MSSVERAAVVANHIAKAEEGITVHVKIAARIESVKGQVAHLVDTIATVPNGIVADVHARASQ